MIRFDHYHYSSSWHHVDQLLLQKPSFPLPCADCCGQVQVSFTRRKIDRMNGSVIALGYPSEAGRLSHCHSSGQFFAGMIHFNWSLFSCMRKWVKTQKERTDGRVEALPSLGGRFFESFPNELQDGVDWTQYRDVFAIYYEASPAPALSAEEREQLAK